LRLFLISELSLLSVLLGSGAAVEVVVDEGAAASASWLCSSSADGAVSSSLSAADVALGSGVDGVARPGLLSRWRPLLIGT
jgi:hypothetical protein